MRVTCQLCRKFPVVYMNSFFVYYLQNCVCDYKINIKFQTESHCNFDFTATWLRSKTIIIYVFFQQLWYHYIEKKSWFLLLIYWKPELIIIAVEQLFTNCMYISFCGMYNLWWVNNCLLCWDSSFIKIQYKQIFVHNYMTFFVVRENYIF